MYAGYSPSTYMPSKVNLLNKYCTMQLLSSRLQINTVCYLTYLTFPTIPLIVFDIFLVIFSISCLHMTSEQGPIWVASNLYRPPHTNCMRVDGL